MKYIDDDPAPTFLGWLRYRLHRVALWFRHDPPPVESARRSPPVSLASINAVMRQMYSPERIEKLANSPSPLWAPARVISDVRAIRARDEQAEPEDDK